MNNNISSTPLNNNNTAIPTVNHPYATFQNQRSGYHKKHQSSQQQYQQQNKRRLQRNGKSRKVNEIRRRGRLWNLPQRVDPMELEKRPARRQALTDNVKTQPVADGTLYNIWYNRYQGGDRGRFSAVDKATTRCVLLKDAGRTRARPKAYFCIHFARGCCSKGPDCQERSYDCFGRERHRDEREDMGGVGSFEKENRTIYVGNVAIRDKAEAIVAKHFSEWGEIEYIRVLEAKGVAFVRYKLRSCAEFAKEAMFGQSLDDNEVLNLRWATEDPNPRVKEIIARQNQQRVMKAIEKTLPQVGEKGSILAYQDPYAEPPDSDYDEDDEEYDDYDEEEGKGEASVQKIKKSKIEGNALSQDTQNLDRQPTAEEVAAYYEQYYAYYGYYPQYDASGNAYDNSAYVYTDDTSANPTASSSAAAEPSAEVEFTTKESSKLAVETTAGGLSGLAAYASDSDEE